MSLPILIDMNLTAEWVPFLKNAGWAAIHWSTVGPADADDATLMEWATSHRYMVFTHDLDFGTALALTQASGPSVIQVRGSRVLPEQIGPLVLAALAQYAAELAAGAIVVIEQSKNRVRILPL